MQADGRGMADTNKTTAKDVDQIISLTEFQPFSVSLAVWCPAQTGGFFYSVYAIV
jgi:hypothetical protein